jgi:hypothetical protein
VESRYSRFSDAPWFRDEVKENIVIGGVGGIGSWVSFFLSRIGHNLNLYDMDTVEETNMGGQFYNAMSVGKSKVDAVKDIIRDFSGCEVSINDEEYTKESMTSAIAISCFDNMKARKVMFNRWKELFVATQDPNMLFVDGRMTAEQGHIYFVTPNPETVKRYEDTLFGDDEVEPLPCSFKATTHNGSVIASQMVAGINNHLSNTYVGYQYRVVPFYIGYMLETFKYDVVL